MAQVVGTLERIFTKDGQFGPRVSYKVNGEWYGGGKYPQRDVAEGDVVQVTYEVNPRGFKDLVKHGGLIKQTGGGATPMTAPAPIEKPAAAPSGGSFYDNRQDTISKQAAFNTALTYLDLQIKLGGIKFPANAKAPDIFAAFETMVNNEAVRLYNINTGKDWAIETAVDDAPKAEAADEYAE